MSKEKADKPSSVHPEEAMSEKKRKRTKAEPEDELEIDINLPEPPSKKAKRKEKKAGKQKTKPPKDAPVAKDQVHPDRSGNITAPDANTEVAKQRSDYGIWIGNLNFTTTKEDLREFLEKQGDIPESDVTRVHLPPPKDGVARKGDKNRGFAYIDFTTKEILDKALPLTEKLLFGRKVLIKNAKNFEGRPTKPMEGMGNASNGDGKAAGSKEPSKRVFVGNLGFDVTREEISQHFGQAGEVEDVFLATFEDSGKCKGFGWVRFAEMEAAEAAVRGFVYREAEVKEDESDGGVDIVADKDQPRAKKEKRRKWFINRLNGRELRREFAEDSQTRYKKQFGKDSKPKESSDGSDVQVITDAPDRAKNGNSERRDQDRRPPRKELHRKTSMNQDERREERRKRHEKMDARKIAPGQAHSSTQRASVAIVAGAGKKTSFD